MSNKAIRMLVRLGISAAVFVWFMLHTSGAFPSRLLSTIENVTYDARILLTMPNTVDPRIVIVDIDEKTLAAEGWPMPRHRIAQLVTELLDRYRVRVIGFDVLFGDPDRTSGIERLDELAQNQMADLPGFRERIDALRTSLDRDRALADAIRGRPVVLGYTFFLPGQKYVKGTLPAGAFPAAFGAPLTLTADDASQTSTTRVLILRHAYNAGFGANGIGAGMEAQAENTAGGFNVLGRID